eukprot:TRINITY_DN20951_c0_g1_i1.p1 TRINITY_DN20951_c0_g1~~TRINITY_DN20951_c0_g1_i1.p1  ORF type:complete len:173 (+),score=21.84 TRINITY_DN20951_c0_g1_i1:44-562(+)
MALIRTFARGRNRVHLFGLPEYGSACGGEEVFKLIHESKPRVVLMETFVAPDAEVDTGGVIPYRSHLNSVGLPSALTLSKDPDFRRMWSCEAVGVLSALSVDAEIRFADRYHSISFDRLLAKRSFDDLRAQVVAATEGLAQQVEQAKSLSPSPGSLAQNAICTLFPELSLER